MKQPPIEAEAVFVFDGKTLTRELLYSEFEAVLDGFVPLPEQASQQVTAVYLRITHGYRALAAVFFTIDFDRQGYPDKRWNVPLQQLADTGADGPNLGAGPIRLACRSQCPIAWHQEQLWDPQLTAETNHLAIIKKALKRNRLRLQLHKPSETQTQVDALSEPGGNDERWRKKLAQAIKEQRLRVATLQEQHRQQLQQEQAAHLAQAQQYLQQISLLNAELDNTRIGMFEQAQTIESQERKIHGLREYFEHKLSSLKHLDAAALTSMQAKLEAEKTAELEAISNSLQDQLQIRDIELMYRESQIANLQEEIDRLHTEKQELLASGGNHLLEEMHKSGISFVTFQPGAGHMTIPLIDVAKFIDDVDGYTAQRCGVEKPLFDQWRRHYQLPRCTHESLTAAGTGQQTCGRSVERVDRPTEFLPGESDRCEEHGISRMLASSEARASSEC